jgi:hypothetical protein
VAAVHKIGSGWEGGGRASMMPSSPETCWLAERDRSAPPPPPPSPPSLSMAADDSADCSRAQRAEGHGSVSWAAQDEELLSRCACNCLGTATQ